MRMASEPKQVTIYALEQWRNWLAKNHEKESKVFMVSYKKHTGKPSISHKEAMYEAICFGWIDTIIKRLDDDRFARGFAKRTDKSRWSSATLGYAKELITQGKMTPAGMKRYKEGLKKPVIDHGLGKNPPVPKDLEVALKKFPKAKAYFNSLAPSYKRVYIIMIERVKLPETRKKRIKDTVARCKAGKRWGQ